MMSRCLQFAEGGLVTHPQKPLPEIGKLKIQLKLVYSERPDVEQFLDRQFA